MRPTVARRSSLLLTSFVLVAGACGTAAPVQTAARTDGRTGGEAAGEVRGQAAQADSPGTAEAGRLENHLQLTFAHQFYKAGESYFSTDGRRLIFQAIPAPAGGEEPGEIYTMYVGNVVRDAAGRITGLAGVTAISAPGSANTCGWFDPQDPSVVLFATTLGPPSPGAPPGYDRSSGRYRWMFPPEMQIVRCTLDRTGLAPSYRTVAGDGTAYFAEGAALSADGRHLVYCSLESGGGDLFVKDLKTGRTAPVAQNEGYDGGPFFSPDGRRICYRSDRHGNHLLQLFVADLEFDEWGSVIGKSREYQLTDNAHVNWGPYWHPGGRHLVYATSELGHRNYEVFLIDADPGDLPGSSGPVRYGTRGRRVTDAPRADVLPTFSSDGRTLVWTSQRGASGRSQLWVADFVMELDPVPTSPQRPTGTSTRSR